MDSKNRKIRDNPDAIPGVLQSCRQVISEATHVRIDADGLTEFARTLVDKLVLESPPDFDGLVYRGDRPGVCNYCLLIDALNFCFWSDQTWEVSYRGQTWTRTPAMEASMLRAIERDPGWLTADRWIDADEAALTKVFAGRGMIPLLLERVSVLNETGAVLRDHFDGNFDSAVEQAECKALSLARLLATRFESFRDVATHHGKPVAFLKRAQICAADLHRMLIANGFDGLTGLDELTVFADYRLPQLFRHRGIIRLDDEFTGRIDRAERIESGSPVEVELRAATIVVADQLVAHMRELGADTAPWRIDYPLWRMARQPNVTTPHHRTVSIYY